LLEDVRAFLGQEGVHRREHARYNDRLQSHGYPVDILEKRVERLLGRAEKRLSLRAQLAVTCALEHLTALMGHMLLGDPRVLEGAHPTMAALWRWHAAEENEHKCVAYEVYLRAGGTYRERTLVMLLVSTVFWIRVIEHQICLTRRNGTLFCAGEWWSLFAFLFVKPGAMRGVVKLYFHYFRPRFHPRDIDSRALVDGWRQTLTSEAAPNTLTLRQP
jgi:hypothetical protein